MFLSSFNLSAFLGVVFCSLKCNIQPMHIRTGHLCVVFLLVCGDLTRAAQTGLRFGHIGLEHGLSQSTVYSIVQDNQGFLWFGTQDGLNRYDGYTIKVFRHVPGDTASMSDNVVWCLLSDREGNLWIGTERGGLNKYVPGEKRFYHFRHSQVDSHSLSSDFITALCEDSFGNLWIGTRSDGLNLYEKKTGRFLRFKNNPADPTSLAGNAIRALTEDHQKNLWIGTSGGVSVLALPKFQENPTKPVFTNHVFSPTIPHSLGSNNVWSIYVDSRKIVWIGTWAGGLNRFDSERGRFVRYRTGTDNLRALPSNTIKSIVEDTEGNLWIGTYDAGLVVLDVHRTVVRKALPDFCVSLYRDNAGLVWIGTFADGVRIFDRKRNLFRHYVEDKSDPTTIRGNLISAIFEDSDGELWIGTYGYGLNYLNRRRQRMTTFRFRPADPQGISSDRVTAVCQSNDGSIWVATTGGIDRYSKRSNVFTRVATRPNAQNGLRHQQVSTLFYDTEADVLYVGYFSGGVSSYHPATNSFVHFRSTDTGTDPLWGSAITVLYRTAEGDVWAGTFNGYLFRKKRKEQHFERVRLPFEEAKHTEHAVYSMLQQRDSLIWFGTYGDGLYRLNTNRHVVRTFNERNSAVSNVLYAILPDGDGRLWMSTNKGLQRFDPASETVKSYDVLDGLQSNEFNQGAFFRSSSGEMFFGGVNGFNAFFPDSIQENTYVPPVYITEFKITNVPLRLPDPIPQGTTIEIPYAENFFSFSFVGLNYSSPEKNRYAYTLEGFDQNWNIVTAQQRYAGYTNLDPGRYVLRVRASNNDGYWNETGTWIAIIITPPFYLTWWFKGLSVIGIVSLAGLIYVRKISTLKREKAYQQEISSKILEKMEEERQRIARELHDSIGQEILFIKNKALLSLTRQNHATVADDLTAISDTASKALKSVREISHNLRPPELDRLGLTETIRALLMKVRESTALVVTGELDHIDGLVPRELEINLVRIVQEAISNILKHARATECSIRIEKERNGIVMTIKDNGGGFTVDPLPMTEIEKAEGMGISGMLERTRMLNGTMTIHSAPGKGTTLEFVFPISPVRERHG